MWDFASITLGCAKRSLILFSPKSVLRPYKRVLNFQARQARKFAIQHGWQQPTWDFPGFLYGRAAAIPQDGNIGLKACSEHKTMPRKMVA